MMGGSVVTLGLLIFENKCYSQNILSLKVAPIGPVDRIRALAGAAQWLDMDIFNIITGEPL